MPFSITPEPDDFLAYNCHQLKAQIAAASTFQSWVDRVGDAAGAAEFVRLFEVDVRALERLPLVLVAPAGLQSSAYAGGASLVHAGGGQVYLLFRDRRSEPIEDCLNSFACRVSRVVNELLAGAADGENAPISAASSDPQSVLHSLAEEKAPALGRWVQSAFLLSFGFGG